MSRELRRPTKARLDDQLGRVYRHSFGAEGQLRVVVRLATLEMLIDGVPRDEIRSALCDAVRGHDADDTTKASCFSGRSRADAIVAMVVRWSDGAKAAPPRR